MINNNRQAGRRRGRGGQQQRPQGNSGRHDSGNRIDNRSRGNAAQLLEKYKALARDAQMSGDRVNTEYYLQFADHYFRVLAETRSRLEENNRPPIQGGANTFQDDEQDYDDEGEPVARAEPVRQQHDGNRQEGRQEGRQDGNRPERQDRSDRQDRPDRQDGNRQERQNGQQNGGYQGERQSEGTRGSQNDRPERQDRQDRQDRPATGERAERQYDDRPRRQNANRDGNIHGNAATAEANGAVGNDQAADRYVREDRGNRNRVDRPERAERPERQPVAERMAVESVTAEQEALPLEEAPRADTPQVEAPRFEEPRAEEQPEAPRRRGRPRREPVAEAAPTFEADRLPPSLNISAVTPDAPQDAPASDVASDEPEEKPRRRRGRPPAAEVTSA